MEGRNKREKTWKMIPKQNINFETKMMAGKRYWKISENIKRCTFT